jgi:hypothetical protein
MSLGSLPKISPQKHKTISRKSCPVQHKEFNKTSVGKGLFPDPFQKMDDTRDHLASLNLNSNRLSGNVPIKAQFNNASSTKYRER